jgi:branched-chain amino acid transport system ATP-binding protein
VFSVVLSEIQPLVAVVGTTRLALFLPILTGPIVTIVLVRNARKQAKLAAGDKSGVRTAAAGEAGSVDSLARLSPTVVAQEVWQSSGPVTDMVLEVQDLSIRLGGLEVLKRVTFTVGAGEVVGLVGPNGAGKTTCFNCISGYQRTWTGEISYGGESLKSLPASSRSKMGLVRTFQGGGLLQRSTVVDNLMVARHRALGYSAAAGVIGTRRSVRAERLLLAQCRDLLARSGIERLEDVPVERLSYGTRRMVEIMCVFATEPRLLMLDEPSSGMSSAEAVVLTQWLSNVRTELEISLLVIEHHVPMVVELCDRVYVLDAGSVIAADVPDKIRVDPAVVTAFLGEPDHVST